MRKPDFDGWVVPGAGATFTGPRRVRLWIADEQPVAPAEWHAYLEIEGVEEYSPRAMPGGSPLQATTLAFVHLHRFSIEQKGFVSSFLDDDGTR